MSTLLVAMISLQIISAFKFKVQTTFTRPATEFHHVPPMATSVYPAQIERPTVSAAMKLGVLYLNLGGPEKQKDVEGFLYNLFVDPDIIRLPTFLSFLQKPIAFFIAKKRAPQSAEGYRAIGGGSPIVKYTQAQADLVESKLRKSGLDARCYFAMRYWNPFTEEVLDKMLADGINTMVIVPLYPQFSISTSGSSLRVIQEIFLKRQNLFGPQKIKHTVVPAWYYREGYISAMAKLILHEVSQYSEVERNEGVHILFSAHGVPQSYIEAGDPYQRQIEDCVRLISREVAVRDAASSVASKPLTVHLSFQSRVGPVQWLRPYTEDKLIDLGKSGVKNLVVVPVSFVSEHIETLEEIDMEYRELAEEHGVVHWRRVPALNTDETFIDDMSDMVIEALQSPTVSVAEAASQSEKVNDVDSATALDSSIQMRLAEKLNGRAAIVGLAGTALLELFTGHPIISSVVH